MDRTNLKLNPTTKHRLERLKKDTETWDGFFNRAATELEQERAAEAYQRQADAQEAIAGMLMLWFEYHFEDVSHTVEALYDEAKFHGTRGERQ